MPSLYGSAGGANRRLRELYARDSGGTTRKLREMWGRDAGAVNRKIFSSGVDWHVSYSSSGLFSISLNTGDSFRVDRAEGAGDGSYSVTYTFSPAILLQPSLSIMAESERDMGQTLVDVNGIYTKEFSSSGDANIDLSVPLSTLRFYKSAKYTGGDAWSWSTKVYINTAEYGDIKLTGSSGTIENT